MYLYVIRNDRGVLCTEFVSYKPLSKYCIQFYFNQRYGGYINVFLVFTVFTGTKCKYEILHKTRNRIIHCWVFLIYVAS